MNSPHSPDLNAIEAPFQVHGAIRDLAAAVREGDWTGAWKQYLYLAAAAFVAFLVINLVRLAISSWRGALAKRSEPEAPAEARAEGAAKAAEPEPSTDDSAAREEARRALMARVDEVVSRYQREQSEAHGLSASDDTGGDDDRSEVLIPQTIRKFGRSEEVTVTISLEGTTQLATGSAAPVLGGGTVQVTSAEPARRQKKVLLQTLLLLAALAFAYFVYPTRYEYSSQSMGANARSLQLRRDRLTGNLEYWSWMVGRWQPYGGKSGG